MALCMKLVNIRKKENLKIFQGTYDRATMASWTKPNKSLDHDECNQPRTKLRGSQAEPFFCFRCNREKTAKLRFEWHTSQGTKIICNGCHGFLTSITPKQWKVVTFRHKVLTTRN